MRCAPSTARRPIRAAGDEWTQRELRTSAAAGRPRPGRAARLARRRAGERARSSWPTSRAWPPQLPAGGPVVNLCVDRYAFARRPGGGAGARPDQPAAARCAARHAGAPASRPAIRTYALAGRRRHRDARHAARPDRAPARRRRRMPRPAVPAIAGSLHAVSLLTSGSTGAPQPHAKSLGARWWATWPRPCGRLAELLGRPSLAGLNAGGDGAGAAQLRPRILGAAGDAGRRRLRQRPALLPGRRRRRRWPRCRSRARW